MNPPTFPTKDEIQSHVTQGITVLNDNETFSNSEGSFWIGVPSQMENEGIEELLREGPDPVKLRIDALPYLARAGLLMLGINAEGMTAGDILRELDGCSVSYDAEVDMIDALRLVLADSD